MTNDIFHLRPLTVAITLLASLPLQAQELATPETAHTGSQESPELIEVIGEQSAAERPGPGREQINDAFGDGLSSADIARSLTPVSGWLLEEAAVEDLRDLQRVAPNTYSATGFGAPSLPTLRGQLGELFELGMRRQVGNNGLGIPLSFNGVGQVDVVRGMPPVMLGATQRTGGFVNLQPKRPSLTDSSGSVTVRAGEWERYRTQLDYSQLLDEGHSAVRVSYEHRDEGSFYDYSSFDSDNLFLAYRLRPTSESEWNLSLEYYDVAWTDNAGINRPTQQLIDDGLYIQGQGVQPGGSSVPGAGALVSPTGTVKIDRSNVYTDPLDINGADTVLLHSVYRLQLSDGVEFVNRTYYEHLEREEIAQNSFVEIIDGADTFQNRSEWIIGNTTAGIDLRYNDVLGYSQFTTEADLPVDLTGPLQNRRIPLTDAQKARLVELRPGVFVSPGGQYDLDGDGSGDFNLSDTTDSTSLQSGLFLQHRQDLADSLWVTAGVRGDWYDVEARDPLAPVSVERAEDSHSAFLKSASASLHFRPLDAVTTYATAAYQESTSNSLAGGNVLSGNNEINPLNFATENALYEVGVKYQPEGGSWYADAALFDQTRSLRNRDGSNSGIRTRGLELQLFYQGENLWANMGASYLDAHFDDSAAFQDVSRVADAFDDSRPDIIEGTGVGAPSFTAFPAADTRLQGIPEWSVSATAGYRFDEAWSVGGSAVFTGSYPLDYLQTVEIPAQYTLNANLQYRFNRERTAVRLDIFNLTDEENWAPVFEGGYFGATLVFPELPRYADLSVSHRF